MPRQDADDAWAAHLALKPAEEASSSRSKSTAAVPDVNAPSRTVRPPFRLFDPFSARLGTRLWLGYPLGLSASALKAKLFGGYQSVSTHGFQGSRSYLRRHGVQFRRAHIWYHKTASAVYQKTGKSDARNYHRIYINAVVADYCLQAERKVADSELDGWARV